MVLHIILLVLAIKVKGCDNYVKGYAFHMTVDSGVFLVTLVGDLGKEARKQTGSRSSRLALLGDEFYYLLTFWSILEGCEHFRGIKGQHLDGW